MASIKKKVVKKRSGGMSSGGKTPTKSDIYRDILSVDGGTTWSEVKAEVKKRFEAAGIPFDEKKDMGGFNVFKGNEKKRIRGGAGPIGGIWSAGGKNISLKQFASLTAGFDPAQLTKTITIIQQVGGIENCKALAAKWSELCRAIGEENARKAIEVL